ncbi:tyrosine- phosphatase Lar-like isoform X1 [Paramuricea clavata]|uniref:Tyrosine- phosphatase Lar-like isoform X1 n=1 Tax=Paramuricea clavata TaxID=317549 RepID=A0A7D9I270_PARCT|nr:tyrosine- phosphatase Lar-like isoform X1 [Paramuricea clavata]
MQVIYLTLSPPFFLARFPDKPTNLTFTNIKSRSAEISWLDPENTGDGNLTEFWIQLQKENSLILNITTNKVNKYELGNLTPFTTYEISLAAGNQNSLGEKTITSFITSEEGPPLNVAVTAESSSSLSVTWEPPEKDKRNGMIVNYTVCISHEGNKPCFKEQTTKQKMLIIRNLIASTKYYVRVLASTKVGFGNYSETIGKFTNEPLFPDKPTNLAVANITSRSAEISWLDPENTGDGDLTGFWIKLKKRPS